MVAVQPGITAFVKYKIGPPYERAIAKHPDIGAGLPLLHAGTQRDGAFGISQYAKSLSGRWSRHKDNQQITVKSWVTSILVVPVAFIKYVTMTQLNIKPDHERRFGGLQRLYGTTVLQQLKAAHVMIAGLGGVGAWSAEALARSGVGKLTLIDLDHVAPSNINRQLHAVTSTVGQAKVDAMAERVAAIQPDCEAVRIDDFVTPENVSELLASRPHVLLDCTDQVAAKVAMILEARSWDIPLVVCGGAGGKTDPLRLRGGDLSLATHDALLNRVRQQLRRHHGYPRGQAGRGKASARPPRMCVSALWFDEPVRLPDSWQQTRDDAGGATRPADPLQGLSCAGYGSVVTVTATMGMAAAGQALELLVEPS